MNIVKHNNKAKFRMKLFSVVFRLFVFLFNFCLFFLFSLIYNWFTCKLIIKTTDAYVYANEQFRHAVFLYVFLVLDIQLWKL